LVGPPQPAGKHEENTNVNAINYSLVQFIILSAADKIPRLLNLFLNS